jgi:voltage-gated potassium channel
MRLLRIAKLGRYYRALHIMSRVIRNQKEELILTVSVMLILLVISSALMYHAENGAQPENFPDIPATMWWSIVTLTTVGYGDVYPITSTGKALAAIIAVFGIGMVALPAGIIGSGFVEEIQNKGVKDGDCCPHCGKPINQHPERD